MKLLFIEGKKNKSKTDKRSSRHVCARNLLDAIIPPTLILQIIFSLLAEETEPQRLRAFPQFSKLLTVHEQYLSSPTIIPSLLQHQRALAGAEVSQGHRNGVTEDLDKDTNSSLPVVTGS